MDAPRLKSEDFLTILDSHINQGLNNHHIETFDELMTTKNGIRQIITEGFSIEASFENERKETEEDKQIANISFEIKFTSVSFGKPTIPDVFKGRSILLYPHTARKRHLTYSAPMHVNVSIRATAELHDGKKIEKQENITDLRIASIPIMVRSKLCNTYGNSYTELTHNFEDPRDPGGYFIVKGREFSINTLESILYNSFHVNKNVHKDEVARGIFISKPGDAFENSFEIIIRTHVNGAITVEITGPNFDGIKIPFYMLYRIFGMTSDVDIIETIIYDFDDDRDITKKMMDQLTYAIQEAPAEHFEHIRHNRNPQEVTQALASYVSKVKMRKTENVMRYTNNFLLTQLDTQLLPHVGGEQHRISKLRYLGHLIRRLLYVKMGIIEGTDKDSYRNKRLHPSGFVFAKAIKRDYNYAVVKPIKQRFISSFKNAPFKKVDIESVFRSSIKPTDLERALVQSIMTGKKTISVGQQPIANRIASQDIQRKNQLNFLSTLRIVSSTGQAVSNQNERAIEMRSVHPSFIGYICVSHSPESGEKVGKIKQLAVTAVISNSSSSELLINKLKDDINITPLEKLTKMNDILHKNMNKVFVNGKWIGVTTVNSHVLAAKYRAMRRREEINKYTTIYVEVMTQDLLFWVDLGRVMRPLLVVYNDNPDDPTATDRKSVV